MVGAWSVRCVGWVDWVNCRCLLSFVFLGSARRLELSPCNKIAGMDSLRQTTLIKIDGKSVLTARGRLDSCAFYCCIMLCVQSSHADHQPDVLMASVHRTILDVIHAESES